MDIEKVNQNEVIAHAIMKMLYDYETGQHKTLYDYAIFTAQEYYNKAADEEENAEAN